ncbi:hypothetical protein GQ457_12G026480 [Hibiscus cannabinus]
MAPMPQAQPHQTENNIEWLSIPQFGGWDQKDPSALDYSMIFTRARATRKQYKSDVRRSIGNERDFMVHPFSQQPRDNSDSAPKKKKILTYINCCIKP